MSYLRDKLLPSPDPVVSPPQESWRKALRDAAEVIRRKGLCKIGYSDRDAGTVCVLGAIRIAAHGDLGNDSALSDRAWPALYRKLFGREPDSRYRRYDIGAWNDAPERTAEEVIAALLSAASAP